MIISAILPSSTDLLRRGLPSAVRAASCPHSRRGTETAQGQGPGLQQNSRTPRRRLSHSARGAAHQFPLLRRSGHTRHVRECRDWLPGVSCVPRRTRRPPRGLVSLHQRNAVQSEGVHLRLVVQRRLQPGPELLSVITTRILWNINIFYFLIAWMLIQSTIRTSRRRSQRRRSTSHMMISIFSCNFWCT